MDKVTTKVVEKTYYNSDLPGFAIVLRDDQGEEMRGFVPAGEATSDADLMAAAIGLWGLYDWWNEGEGLPDKQT